MPDLELFGRAVRLTLAVPKSDSFFALRSLTNADVIEDMRVKFKIERSRESQPNTAQVVIHGLNSEHRAAFARKPLQVRLDAGYTSEGLSRVFQGDLLWGHSTKPTDTWITNLDLGDGARAYRHARGSRSFKAGTTIKTVVADLAGTMGLSVPGSIREAKEFAQQFGSGVSVQGPSRRSMNSMMKMGGHGWSIQDGGLQVLKPDAANSVQAILLSEATGVLGSPDYGPPKDPKKRPILTIRSYLDPRIRPGSLLQVEMRDVQGLFVASKVIHEGDSLGAQWYTTVEATPYG